MKISYNWLHDYVDFTHSPKELGDLLDSLGLGVEALNEIKAKWSNVVVGKVIQCEPVPATEHLSHCIVDIGNSKTVPIVCGAPNIAAGQTVPVALVGAELPGGFKIGRRKLKGVESQGMICSEKELDISDAAGGIMVLPESLHPGSPLENYISRGDWIYDLEITFNRPDCLCHVGVAREIAAAVGMPLLMPHSEVAEEDETAESKISIEILAPDKCPRYSARIVEGVTVKPSPLWMQERLRSVGIRAINNVVDITNYILMELGHPLHAFDYHLVNEGKIIVRQAEEGEKFTTLDEKEHKLQASDLLIADPQRGIALAGVMGGLNSEIKDDTQDVLIECAYFEPVGIRETSRDRGITTESSHRFERGVDPELTPFAAGRAARLIKELAGGRVLKGYVDAYPKKWKASVIDLRPPRVNSILATDIPVTQMSRHMRALGCQVTEELESGNIRVVPPSWRHDLAREIDLIEEIARLHGYDKINTAATSSVPLIPDLARERERRMIDLLKRSMMELGMREAISYSLIPESDADALKIDLKKIRIINPISEDMAVLRPNLASSLLRAAQRNWRGGIQDIRLFEWGKCFWLEKDSVREEWKLSGVLTGNTQPESWMNKYSELNIYDLKGLLERYTDKISLDNVQFISYHIPEFLLFGGNIFAGVGEDQEIVGSYGQVDPSVACHFDLEFPVWYFELNGETLLKRSGHTPQYQHLPRFPAAFRDLAFIVDESLEMKKLKDVLVESGGEFLEEVELFDVFHGGSLSNGKKSLAFHLTYRSPVRTLSDTEIDLSVKQIIVAAEREIGAVLRSI